MHEGATRTEKKGDEDDDEAEEGEEEETKVGARKGPIATEVAM